MHRAEARHLLQNGIHISGLVDAFEFLDRRLARRDPAQTGESRGVQGLDHACQTLGTLRMSDPRLMPQKRFVSIQKSFHDRDYIKADLSRTF